MYIFFAKMCVNNIFIKPMNNKIKMILLIKYIYLKKYTNFSNSFLSCGEVSVGGTGTGIVR